MSNIKVGDTVEKISGDSFLGSSLTNTVEAVDGRKVLTKETATTVFIDKSKPSTKSCKLSWIDEFVQSSLLDRMFTREIVRNTTLRCLVIYDFVRASSNLSSYREEFAKSSTPISYMAAQLVDRYADELLKNRVEISLNSTRTPVMVEAVKAYNKRLDSLKTEDNRKTVLSDDIVLHVPYRYTKYNSMFIVESVEGNNVKVLRKTSASVRVLCYSKDDFSENIKNKLFEKMSLSSLVGKSYKEKTQNRTLTVKQVSLSAKLAVEDESGCCDLLTFTDILKYFDEVTEDGGVETTRSGLCTVGTSINGLEVFEKNLSSSNKYFLECTSSSAFNYTVGKIYVWDVNNLTDDYGVKRTVVHEYVAFRVIDVAGKNSFVEPTVKEQEIHVPEINNSSAPLVTKNCNQYQHGSTLEMHSNRQEEKTMSEEVKTNTVVVEVSTEPYAETTVATFFGKVIDSKSESELTHVISVIDDKQEALKALNKNAKSRRIIGQINKLGAARTKVVAMLDSLPE